MAKSSVSAEQDRPTLDKKDQLRQSRVLSTKGKENFEERLRMKDDYDKTWREIEDTMYTFEDKQYDVKTLRVIDMKVTNSYKKLLTFSDIILSYLDEQRTESASKELEIYETQHPRRIELTKRFRNIDAYSSRSTF